MQGSSNNNYKLASNWSLGWGQTASQSNVNNSPQVKKYHNESHFQFQDNTKVAEKQQSSKKQQKIKTQDNFNQKLPNYDPKQGGKSTIHFGDQKTDYRPKDKVFTNQNMKKTQKGRFKF